MCNCRNSVKGQIRRQMFGRGSREPDIKFKNHETIDVPEPTPIAELQEPIPDDNQTES